MAKDTETAKKAIRSKDAANKAALASMGKSKGDVPRPRLPPRAAQLPAAAAVKAPPLPAPRAPVAQMPASAAGRSLSGMLLARESPAPSVPPPKPRPAPSVPPPKPRPAPSVPPPKPRPAAGATAKPKVQQSRVPTTAAELNSIEASNRAARKLNAVLEAKARAAMTRPLPTQPTAKPEKVWKRDKWGKWGWADA